MSATAQSAIILTGVTTYEAAVAALAIHFGGAPVDLSTGEVSDVPFRDASAVFTGSAALTVSSGATPESTPPGAAEVDKNGLPWDDRIHSSSKSKNADGSWRGKKGVPPPTIAKVKAELLAKLGGAPTASTPPTAEQANVQNNDEAARLARINHAREKAFAIAGPMNTDEDTFAKLQRGVLVTVPPYVEEWFTKWQAAFNNAYKEYVQQAQGVTMGMQTINPESQTNQPVAIVGMPGDATPPAAAQTPQAAAPAVDTFATFAAHYGAHFANPVLGEVLATLGIGGGVAALATAEPMIPAVKALLAAKGIV